VRQLDTQGSFHRVRSAHIWWGVRLLVALGGVSMASTSAWAQCGPTVAAGVVCVESNENYSDPITVDGSYTGNNITNHTTAASAAAFVINGTGTVNLSGSLIETDSDASYGFVLNGGSLNARDTRVITLGNDSDALVLRVGSIGAVLNDIELTTHGSRSSGIEAFDGTTLTGTNVIIRTTQAGPGGGAGESHGVFMLDDTSVSLYNAEIYVDGIDSSGIEIWGGGQFYGENIKITVSSDFAALTPSGIYVLDIDSKATILGGEISTSGDHNHALYADGGIIEIDGVNVSASGTASSAIYLSNPSSPYDGLVRVSGGSLASLSAPLILNGPIGISPGLVAGREVFASVTDLPGIPSDFNLTLNQVNTARGDIDVTGAGNTFRGAFNASTWVGNLLVDVGNTANLSLNGSTWTGRAANASAIALDPAGIWNITGASNAASVDSAGLIAFDPAAVGFPTLTATDFVGQDGRLRLNTVLNADGSPSNLLVVDGGSASGTTGLLIANAGGNGAQTTGDGIRVVEAINGGTTGTDAFALGARAAAGAYEYLLYRSGGAGAEDWFLRSHLTQAAQPDIPLYRPEMPLYMAIPSLARQTGLATLGTLHEREGELRNIEPPDTMRGAWARVIAQGGDSSWDGPIDVHAVGTGLAGLQAGVDIYRAEHENGDRDYLGLYAALTSQTSRIEGFALGQDRLAAGKVQLSGPTIGAYWTHYGATGGYLDGVVQVNLLSASGISDYGARLDTTALGFAASLEAGYPFALGEGWEIEPQGQLIYQSLGVNSGRDAFSSVSFDADDALTARLGLRLQYSTTVGDTLLQPYAKANLWHGFGGRDSTSFAQTSFDRAFGDTALELGAGLSAKINDTVSLFGHVDHRWSLAGQERSTVTQGSLGLRVNW
jgi:outer membrane autotransporter protein